MDGGNPDFSIALFSHFVKKKQRRAVNCTIFAINGALYQ